MGEIARIPRNAQAVPSIPRRSSSSGGTPGGSDTQVQFNDSSAFGGDAGLTYNKTTDTLTAANLALTNDLPVTEGGTGASSAGDARTNLGLGTIATQNANNVTISGGAITGITDLAVADGGTGASTAANARTNLGVGTGDSPQFTAVNIGDASDTTLTRSAAGVLAVEGIDVVTLSASQTLTNKTLTSPVLTTPSAFTTGGTITLAENTSIALDPAGSADGKYSGITVAGTAGATLAFGDLVYLAAADSRWELADADAASTSGDVMLGICVLAAASDGDPTTILLHGIIRADAAFPALTISAQVYVSTTAGDIQVAQPSETDDVIRVVGRALTADEIYFNPSEDYITHT